MAGLLDLLFGYSPPASVIDHSRQLTPDQVAALWAQYRQTILPPQSSGDPVINRPASAAHWFGGANAPWQGDPMRQWGLGLGPVPLMPTIDPNAWWHSGTGNSTPYYGRLPIEG